MTHAPLATAFALSRSARFAFQQRSRTNLTPCLYKYFICLHKNILIAAH
jgi:hypothetical protein